MQIDYEHPELTEANFGKFVHFPSRHDRELR